MPLTKTKTLVVRSRLYLFRFQKLVFEILHSCISHIPVLIEHMLLGVILTKQPPQVWYFTILIALRFTLRHWLIAIPSFKL